VKLKSAFCQSYWSRSKKSNSWKSYSSKRSIKSNFHEEKPFSITANNSRLLTSKPFTNYSNYSIYFR